jgi:hypothetical protein
MYARLKQKGVRLVVAEVMQDVASESHYRLLELFGEDAFYDRLGDVVKDYLRQSNQAEGRNS